MLGRFLRFTELWLAMCLAALLLELSLSGSSAHADKRVALVIGNSGYAGLSKLPNPEVDARAIAQMLADNGFDVGEVRLDLGVAEFQRALIELNKKVQDADVAVVFYAGHGIEVSGTNWLVPVDAKLETDFAVRSEAVALGDVIDAIAPARMLRFVILDACRNDPFRPRMKRTTMWRAAVDRGLTVIDENALPRNTLVAYAAKAGTTAKDGPASQNSPFTTALLKYLPQPGLDVRIALGHVRDDVLAATSQQQEPFSYSSLGGGQMMLKRGVVESPSRKEALLNQSRFLTEAAQAKLREHNFELAALLAREALPASSSAPERPLWQPALTILAEAQAGDRLRAVWDHEGSVLASTFSPDGQRVLTACADGTARLWDARTGGALSVLAGHLGSVLSATFSPDGLRVVTASYDKISMLRDARTGDILRFFIGHDDQVRMAVFSPDGHRVLTASRDKTARLWDARPDTAQVGTDKRSAALMVLKGHQDGVSSAVFSPDGGRVLTASRDKTARLWDARTGILIAVLEGHLGEVYSASFSPDGQRIVTASEDETARLWDGYSGTPLAVLKGHLDSVWSASFSPDGQRVVTTSGDKTARLWDAPSGTMQVLLSGHNGWVSGAAFSPDGLRVLTTSGDKTARLWDARTGAILAVLKGHQGPVFSPAFSPDGKRIVTASRRISQSDNDMTARLWDAREGTAGLLLKGHQAAVFSAAFSTDGARLVTASADSTARLWDARTGAGQFVLNGHEEAVLSAAFSPDGRRVVTGSRDKAAWLWDAQSGASMTRLKGHLGPVSSAAFSPDGQRVVTASGDKTARVWDAHTGATLVELKGHQGWVFSGGFSPDGRRVVTASADKTARLWNAYTGATLATLHGHNDWVSSAAFSPDGQRVVTASGDKTARLWDARSGAMLQVLAGPEKAIASAAFSPDGKRLVAASYDKTVWVWDAETGAVLEVLRGHLDRVIWASFSSDGQRLVTASEDETARLWELSILGTERSDYHSIVTNRTLTSDERAEFFLPSLDKPAVRSPTRSQDEKATDCDLLAAHPDDPQKRSVGIDLNDIKDDAVAACRSAIASQPKQSRFIFQLARALAKKGEHTEAFALYKRAAERGHVAAHIGIAEAYKDGNGTKREIEAAIRHYRVAWDAGLIEPSVDLSEIYFVHKGNNSINHAQALDWLQKGAAAGSPRAHQTLARYYESGLNGQQSLELALHHYIIATRLYEEAGEEARAQSMRYRRASLARSMPSREVVKIAAHAVKWSPAPRK
jgi:WD40 repeat protein